jgi:predicted metalloprotease with PDZ domain
MMCRTRRSITNTSFESIQTLDERVLSNSTIRPHPPIEMILVVSLLISVTQAASDSRYEVTFGDTSGRAASVVASIDVGGDRLSMRNGGNNLPQGFATFVTIRSVRDSSGRNVGFRRDSISQWKLDKPIGRATITYDIDLSFARESWPSGNEQAAQWDAGALYSVTKPFFVTGVADAAAEVSFRLPRGWAVATPWPTVTGKANTFSVKDESSLTDNSIVIGRFRTDKFVTGPFSFTLATFGGTSGAAPLMSNALKLVAKEYVRVFPETPPTSYLMTVFMGSENDGEAFDQSFAFRTGSVPSQSNAIMWATTLAHELFHFWNGHSMRGADGTWSAWLSEGVTEYYANRTLLRTGVLPASAFLAKAENMAGLYTYFRTQPMFDSVTVGTAGSRRTRYRFGVYNGGWAAGFALDRLISESTGGRASLDDVMRDLFTAHAEATNPYTAAEFVSIVSKAAGKDMRPFFAQYVDGKGLLPLEALFNGLGIDANFISYTGEAYFTFRPSPTATQRADWKRYSNQQ